MQDAGWVESKDTGYRLGRILGYRMQIIWFKSFEKYLISERNYELIILK